MGEDDRSAVDILQLPFLALADPGFARDPMSRFAEAREVHPWLARTEHGLVVHGYRALIELARLDHKMVPPHPRLVELVGGKGTDWGDFMERSIQALSGHAHKRLRDVLAPAFTPRQAKLHRGLMRKTVAELLDQWAPAGSFDFEEFASCFPISVMCRLIGAPTDMLPALRPSLEAMGQGFTVDAAMLPALQSGLTVMRDFVEGLIAERRVNRRGAAAPDLLDVLLEVHRDGELTERELSELLIFLFVAGYDTSKNSLTLLMYVLLDKPDIYRKCAEDPGFCRATVDEMFRYLGIITGAKILIEDVELEGVRIPAGTFLFLAWGAGGRDPAAFSSPDRFDPMRKQRNQLAFGGGLHICLGQFIARAQIEEGLHAIAQRIRKPRLTGKVEWRPFIGIWGLRGLPISFEPEAARQ